MLRRLLFYALYFCLTLASGYMIDRISWDDVDYEQGCLLLLSFTMLYLFSSIFVRTGVWSRVAITVSAMSSSLWPIA